MHGPVIGLGRPRATWRAGIVGSGPKIAASDGDIGGGSGAHVLVEMDVYNNGAFDDEVRTHSITSTGFVKNRAIRTAVSHLTWWACNVGEGSFAERGTRLFYGLT